MASRSTTPIVEAIEPSTPAQEAERPLAPAVARRNYRLGVINGVLFALGESLSSAGLVLALLVRQLGGSLLLVGLLPSLQSGGFLLPQLLVGSQLQSWRYKLPLYRRAAIARIVAFVTVIGAIFAATSLSPTISLWLIVICYSVYNLGGGTSTLAFQDVVAKVIPPRRRGSFFGARQLLGGLLSFAIAGPLVRWLLGRSSPLPFPQNFGVLCSLALVAIAIGLMAFALIDEPPQAHPGPRMRVIEGLRRAPSILRTNGNYRWFIISRMLTRAGMIAEPFYLIYATEALGLPAGVAGIFLAVRASTGALSNLVWSRISDRQGNRQLILLSGILVICPPLVVLLGSLLATALGLGHTGMLIAMGLVFFVSGAANDGNGLAGSTYLLEIVPEDERPTYIGLANTMLGVVTFLPVLGGWLVTRIGYSGTFVTSLMFALLGLLASAQLREGRAR